jgi:hypothetical protein
MSAASSETTALPAHRQAFAAPPATPAAGCPLSFRDDRAIDHHRLAADGLRVVARDEASIGLIFQISFTVILATRKLSLKKAAAITNFALRAGNVGI